MFDVNYVAIVVASIVHIIIGLLWYSPAAFGKAWMRLSGISKDDMEKMRKKGMGKSYIVAFIGALVMALVLSNFIALVGASTFAAAANLAFWIWLGFLATTMLGMVVWEGKPTTLYLINVAYQLIALVVMSSILTLWG